MAKPKSNKGKGGKYSDEGRPQVATPVANDPKNLDEQKKQLKQAQKRVESKAARVQRQKKRRSQLKSRIQETEGKKRKEKLRDKKQAVAQKLRGNKKDLKQRREKRDKLRRYTTTTPADPGKPTPTIDPFMTAEDIIDMTEATAERTSIYSELDAELAKLAADQAYEYSDIQRQTLEDKNEADFDAAARGMQHSSIRDAELYDIDGTAAIRRSMLATELQTATLDTQRQKGEADTAYEIFKQRMNQRMVENAQEASADLPMWEQEPTPAQTNRHRLPIPGRGPKKNNQGGGKGNNTTPGKPAGYPGAGPGGPGQGPR